MDPFTLAVVTGIIATVGAAGLLALAGRSPKLMKKIKRYFQGVNFLVLGPSGTGKSSFLNYLRYDQFADIYPTKKTVSVTPIKSFSVDKAGELKLDISETSDIPGELTWEDQVNIIREEKPTAVIVFLASDKENCSFHGSPDSAARLITFF